MPLVTHLQFKNSRTGDEQDHDVFNCGTGGELRAAQVALIYGRNGAGKSTFAKDLSRAVNDRECTVRLADGEVAQGLVSDRGQAVMASLFNENFVNDIGYRQQKTRTGDLSTIVLFGEQKANREQLDSLREEENSLLERLEDLRGSTARLTSKGEGSIQKQTDHLKSLLRGEGSWSDYQQRATSSPRGPRIGDSVLQSLFQSIATQNEESTDEITARRTELLEILQKGQGKFRVNPDIPDFVQAWDLAEVGTLFSTVPQIAEDNFLMSTLKTVLDQKSGGQLLQFAEEIFSRPETTHCPMCAQAVGRDQRLALLSTLRQMVGSNERAEIVRRVEALPNLKVDLPAGLESAQREAISVENANKYENARNYLLVVVEQLYSLANQKADNPERSLELPTDTYLRAVENFQAARNDCLVEIESFNSAVDFQTENLELFQKLNIQVASRDAAIRDSAETLLLLEEELMDCRQQCRDAEARLQEIKYEVDTLKSQQLNHEAALNLINEYLAVVFADSDRLKLRPADNSYRVLSRGQDVLLQDLSTGERNIIALAYFFADIFRGSDDYRTHKQQRFIILDDPVSSFDSDNRFGVFLLIKQVIERFVQQSDTQVVITSHDLGLVQDLATVIKAVGNASATVRQIEKHCLRPMNLEAHTNYSGLLRKMYDFACAEDPEQVEPEDIPTGNEIRLVLEAFAQFEVSRGIIDLPEARVVSARVEGESVALSRYFHGPLYRLILHGESHSADSVRAGNFGLEPVATSSDRQQIAQDVITLISIISPVHIPAKLKFVVPGTKQDDRNHQIGFEENCNRWKLRIEQRTLAPAPAKP